MDRNNQNSPQLGYPIDDVGDLKYVSGLSTILVATIQEAKDRISQIEYIFCNQLFPNFQSKSKTLQKIYNDAREAAEDAWKNKESDLVLQIERLQLENKMVIEESQSLKLENAKFLSSLESLLHPLETNSYFVGNSEKKLKELEEKNVILQNQRTSEIEDQTIPREFVKKSKEAVEGMEQKNRLLQLVQSKASLVLQKDKQLADHEEMKKKLLVQIECLEKNARTVQEQLCEKSNEVRNENMLHKKLLIENNSYVSLNLNNQQLLDECEKEKKLLTGKVKSLEKCVNELQWKAKHKNEEVEECRKLHEQYLEQIDRDTKELLKAAQQVEKLEKENLLLVDNRIGLQEKTDKLEVFLRQRANETSEGLELHGKLLQRIEEKDSELQSEKKKRRDLIAVHKNLKSQYNFLLAKFGLTTECSNPPNEMKNERNCSRLGQSPYTSPDNGMKALVQGSSCELPSGSNCPAVPMEPINTRSGLLAGTKRSVSSWRDTRSHQREGGFDPHDDFLDTPLENIIGKIKKFSKDEQVYDIPDRVPEDINFDNSDEETQDLAGELALNKPAPGPGAKSGFKYIEPVRKRAERENLKGIECKQCRKFYDAVHPDGGDKNNSDLRCEHHEGVSRHRYRFAPPSTPEGFWNIGFESEM